MSTHGYNVADVDPVRGILERVDTSVPPFAYIVFLSGGEFWSCRSTLRGAAEDVSISGYAPESMTVRARHVTGLLTVPRSIYMEDGKVSPLVDVPEHWWPES